VAELAQVAPADVRGVLSRLDPDHRDQVQALLAAYEGEPAAVEAGPREAVVAPLGLSPWLEARVEGAALDPGFAMTAAASATLRACVPAPDQGARPASPPRPSPPPARSRGLDVVLDRLRKRP